jgi:hypothetical protein
VGRRVPGLRRVRLRPRNGHHRRRRLDGSIGSRITDERSEPCASRVFVPSCTSIRFSVPSEMSRRTYRRMELAVGLETDEALVGSPSPQHPRQRRSRRAPELVGRDQERSAPCESLQRVAFKAGPSGVLATPWRPGLRPVGLRAKANGVRSGASWARVLPRAAYASGLDGAVRRRAANLLPGDVRAVRHPGRQAQGRPRLDDLERSR